MGESVDSNLSLLSNNLRLLYIQALSLPPRRAANDVASTILLKSVHH